MGMLTSWWRAVTRWRSGSQHGMRPTRRGASSGESHLKDMIRRQPRDARGGKHGFLRGRDEDAEHLVPTGSRAQHSHVFDHPVECCSERPCQPLRPLRGQGVHPWQAEINNILTRGRVVHIVTRYTAGAEVRM